MKIGNCLPFSSVLLVILLTTAIPTAASDQKVVYSVFWSGCESVCDGIKDYIEQHKLDVKLIIRNADRDRSKLSDFIKEAKMLNVDLVTTWGTTTTLGIIGTLDDSNNENIINKIPVVFTLVSDPIRSRIIKGYDSTGRPNVTGTRNRVPESMNIKIMRKIKPEFQKLGIIYNPIEKNSIAKVEEIRELQASLNFKLEAVELRLNTEGKPIAESINMLVAELKQHQVDFIYLGSSTYLEKEMDRFTNAAIDNGLPILSPYENLVRDSFAFMSIAARDHDVGTLVGEQINKILFENKTPGDLPVISVDQYAYVFNMDTARKINIFPPLDILQVAEIVE